MSKEAQETENFFKEEKNRFDSELSATSLESAHSPVAPAAVDFQDVVGSRECVEEEAPCCRVPQDLKDFIAGEIRHLSFVTDAEELAESKGDCGKTKENTPQGGQLRKVPDAESDYEYTETVTEPENRCMPLEKNVKEESGVAYQKEAEKLVEPAEAKTILGDRKFERTTYEIGRTQELTLKDTIKEGARSEIIGVGKADLEAVEVEENCEKKEKTKSEVVEIRETKQENTNNGKTESETIEIHGSRIEPLKDWKTKSEAADVDEKMKSIATEAESVRPVISETETVKSEAATMKAVEDAGTAPEAVPSEKTRPEARRAQKKTTNVAKQEGNKPEGEDSEVLNRESEKGKYSDEKNIQGLDNSDPKPKMSTVESPSPEQMDFLRDDMAQREQLTSTVEKEAKDDQARNQKIRRDRQIEMGVAGECLDEQQKESVPVEQTILGKSQVAPEAFTQTRMKRSQDILEAHVPAEVLLGNPFSEGHATTSSASKPCEEAQALPKAGYTIDQLASLAETFAQLPELSTIEEDVNERTNGSPISKTDVLLGEVLLQPTDVLLGEVLLQPKTAADFQKSVEISTAGITSVDNFLAVHGGENMIPVEASGEFIDIHVPDKGLWTLNGNNVEADDSLLQENKNSVKYFENIENETKQHFKGDFENSIENFDSQLKKTDDEASNYKEYLRPETQRNKQLTVCSSDELDEEGKAFLLKGENDDEIRGRCTIVGVPEKEQTWKIMRDDVSEEHLPVSISTSSPFLPLGKDQQQEQVRHSEKSAAESGDASENSDMEKNREIANNVEKVLENSISAEQGIVDNFSRENLSEEAQKKQQCSCTHIKQVLGGPVWIESLMPLFKGRWINVINESFFRRDVLPGELKNKENKTSEAKIVSSVPKEQQMTNLLENPEMSEKLKPHDNKGEVKKSTPSASYIKPVPILSRPSTSGRPFSSRAPVAPSHSASSGTVLGRDSTKAKHNVPTVAAKTGTPNLSIKAPLLSSVRSNEKVSSTDKKLSQMKPQKLEMETARKCEKLPRNTRPVVLLAKEQSSKSTMKKERGLLTSSKETSLAAAKNTESNRTSKTFGSPEARSSPMCSTKQSFSICDQLNPREGKLVILRKDVNHSEISKKVLENENGESKTMDLESDCRAPNALGLKESAPSATRTMIVPVENVQDGNSAGWEAAEVEASQPKATTRLTEGVSGDRKVDSSSKQHPTSEKVAKVQTKQEEIPMAAEDNLEVSLENIAALKFHRKEVSHNLEEISEISSGGSQDFLCAATKPPESIESHVNLPSDSTSVQYDYFNNEYENKSSASLNGVPETQTAEQSRVVQEAPLVKPGAPEGPALEILLTKPSEKLTVTPCNPEELLPVTKDNDTQASTCVQFSRVRVPEDDLGTIWYPNSYFSKKSPEVTESVSLKVEPQQQTIFKSSLMSLESGQDNGSTTATESTIHHGDRKAFLPVSEEPMQGPLITLENKPYSPTHSTAVAADRSVSDVSAGLSSEFAQRPSREISFVSTDPTALRTIGKNISDRVVDESSWITSQEAFECCLETPPLEVSDSNDDKKHEKSPTVAGVSAENISSIPLAPIPVLPRYSATATHSVLTGTEEISSPLSSKPFSISPGHQNRSQDGENLVKESPQSQDVFSRDDSSSSGGQHWKQRNRRGRGHFMAPYWNSPHKDGFDEFSMMRSEEAETDERTQRRESGRNRGQGRTTEEGDRNNWVEGMMTDRPRGYNWAEDRMIEGRRGEHSSVNERTTGRGGELDWAQEKTIERGTVKAGGDDAPPLETHSTTTTHKKKRTRRSGKAHRHQQQQ